MGALGADPLQELGKHHEVPETLYNEGLELDKTYISARYPNAHQLNRAKVVENLKERSGEPEKLLPLGRGVLFGSHPNGIYTVGAASICSSCMPGDHERTLTLSRRRPWLFRGWESIHIRTGCEAMRGTIDRMTAEALGIAEAEGPC